VAPPEQGSPARESTVDVDDARTGGCEELVDRAVGPVLEGFDDHLGVDRGGDQDVIAADEVPSEHLDGLLMLSV
jgi:hypothetical protein